jgi:ABC-2 type transport system permease protein
MINLLKSELLSRRTGMIGWGLGMAFFAILYLGLYPEVAGFMDGMQDISIYKAMGINLGGFEGFAASTSIQFLPVILGIFAIIHGTGILAGEEDNGTLELILASPLKRGQIVSMKALALGIILLIILIIAGLGNVLILKIIDVDTFITSGKLFMTVLNGWPIVMAFTMLSLWLGAMLPNRRSAALVATVVLLINYFGMMMVNMVESLDILKRFLLFGYYDATPDVFLEGIQFSDVTMLLGISIAFLCLALWCFQRRNVTVGEWSWR